MITEVEASVPETASMTIESPTEPAGHDALCDAMPEVDDGMDASAEAHTDNRDDSADKADRLEGSKGRVGRRTRLSWTSILAYVLLPGLALALTLGVGYLKWRDGSARLSQEATTKSVQAATESTIAILSYHADTAEKELRAASDRLTGSFRDDYTKLINEVVIPGAKQKQISTVATVPAASSVSADADHAVVLVFVNQTITIGNDAPTNSASSVRVTLTKAGGRWLMSQFDPV